MLPFDMSLEVILPGPELWMNTFDYRASGADVSCWAANLRAHFVNALLMSLQVIDCREAVLAGAVWLNTPVWPSVGKLVLPGQALVHLKL